MAEKWIPRVGERVQLREDGEAVVSAIIGNEAPYVYEVTQYGKIPEVFHVGIDDMARIERPSFDSFLCEEGDEVLIIGCSKYQGRIGIFEGIEPALEGMFHVVHFDRDPSRHAFKEEHILPMKIFDTRIELAITKALNIKRGKELLTPFPERAYLGVHQIVSALEHIIARDKGRAKRLSGEGDRAMATAYNTRAKERRDTLKALLVSWMEGEDR